MSQVRTSRPAGVLVLILILCTANAQKLVVNEVPPANTSAIVSPTHPIDSRGETVYEFQGKLQQDIPVVPGTLLPPVTVKTITPKYPKTLKRSKADATVRILGIIAANGDFIDGNTTDTTDPDAAKSALEAASHYKFRPATLDGKPVAVELVMDIHFAIRQ